MNLANSAYDKVLAGSPVEKDIILRKMCLNLYIDDKRVPSFIWREPFATLVTARKNTFGATEATTFEHICIIAEWLFDNNAKDLFRMPRMTIEQRQQQMKQANYCY